MIHDPTLICAVPFDHRDGGPMVPASDLADLIDRNRELLRQVNDQAARVRLLEARVVRMVEIAREAQRLLEQMERRR